MDLLEKNYPYIIGFSNASFHFSFLNLCIQIFSFCLKMPILEQIYQPILQSISSFFGSFLKEKFCLLTVDKLTLSSGEQLRVNGNHLPFDLLSYLSYILFHLKFYLSSSTKVLLSKQSLHSVVETFNYIIRILENTFLSLLSLVNSKKIN